MLILLNLSVKYRIILKEIYYEQGHCPEAERALASMMVLPCNESMGDADARDIAAALAKVCGYHLENGNRKM